MDGINGFYTLEIRPRDVPCEAQVEILKRGYGRGSLSTQQSLKGRTNIRQENNWWQVPIAVGAGGDRTDMTFWLRQGSGRLQGYWYYANNSWGQAPLYGIVEGRRDLFEDRPAELPGMQRQLDSCELKGQPQVSYDDCKPGG
ncbi:MAG: hypothetical protein EA397_15065 [Deltaproteobacteria bacterium]|nr:MAG: hypothetical protein EA397_15065 [Deltaproteobacteria bacterium]